MFTVNTFCIWCRFVGKYLKVMNRLNGATDKERQLVREFTTRYLRQDGVFVLRYVQYKVFVLIIEVGQNREFASR